MTNSDFMPIERYYRLKAIFERIWGKGTYLELKHCSDLKVWKRYCERTLRATELAASDTVLIVDEDWQNELSEIIEHGIDGVTSASGFDELFQYFAATYAEVSFHQFGFMPSVDLAARSQLRRGNWRLDAFRSVQYIQTPEQKESQARRKKKREKS